ncbi:MAG: hypothetical protein U0228_30275 [Myxococcaceae bacterium]
MADPAPPPEESGLPLIALVLSVVGLCFPPLLLVSFTLGLIVFTRKDPRFEKRKQFGQMAMLVSGVGALIFVAMVLPNYKRFTYRRQQDRCRVALTDVVTAERAFYEANKRYAVTMRDLPPTLAPPPLLIIVGPGADGKSGPALEPDMLKILLDQAGLHGDCPACSFTALCAQQLDGDPTIDTWSVSSIERLGANGEKIAGGLPWNETDDVRE